ncbi:PSP1-domain-containing protein [Dendrothele bispora CBS 962.96]|uniref:PSP1-domain-containing protein n=1 Tax=Dendrothele bispora (strain CBS 962.96) TaxID=1314807 RepID=A0A4S8L9W8_DENBC|nr:PSP1-domain-containing protein [Dendrothele bispora CBS 962.96]
MTGGATGGGPDPGVAASAQGSSEHGLGRGVPLSAVPAHWQLYIVEFKAGRTDLFYLTDAQKGEMLRAEGGQQNGHGANPLNVGDYVIVEADRGRDLGRVVNDSITIEEVERWLEGRAAAAANVNNPNAGAGSGGPDSSGAWGDTPISPTMSSHPPGSHGSSSHKKEINPKQIYAKAGPSEASLLATKMADEVKALQLCQSKVRAKKLPMEVVDAEYQWDRRKLTFYFVAEKRIDFRELVRELFRLYKTRIWMASLQGAGGFEQ